MGNSLRCCLACVLPCGALDLIRVVHINGHVEEYSGPVFAGEVLRAHPNHVLSKPCPLDDPCSAAPRRAVIVHPDSALKRGEIYFLLPEATPATGADDGKQRRKGRSTTTTPDGHTTKKAPRRPLSEIPPSEATETEDNVSSAAAAAAAVAAADGYLTELMSERKTMHRRRKSGRVGVWRHQLESITEDD